jgi:small GTP-binding protein
MRSLKVAVVGDTTVGKSCILTHFAHGTFHRDVRPSIGTAFLAKVVTTSKGTARLHLWDTAGQEKFRSLAPSLIDVTSKQTFDGLEDWTADSRYR